MTTDVGSCFSQSYAEARERFRAACRAAGLEVVSYPNPRPGPAGEALATDVARLGPAEARRVLIVESGTHGVEGYAGSGIQVGLLTLAGAPRPPAGVALLLVHALNPWGFAWTRRTNEDNVDLNRSFVDHEAGAYPANPGYAALAEWIVPAEWTPAGIAAADAALADYAARNGAYALQSAYKFGQHSHPAGLFFGGLKPTWSAGTVRRIAAEHLAGVERAGLIDLHTGLGPFGRGECLAVSAPDTPEGRRASAWYGEVRHTKDESSGYSGSDSTIIAGYRRAAPTVEWTSIGLEFGTRPPERMRLALRAEGWLHAHAGPDHPDHARIKRELRDAFYPQEPDWAPMVLARGHEVVRLGLAGLAGG